MDHPWIVLVCAVIVLFAMVVALRRPRYPESGPVASGASRPPTGPVTLPDDVRAEIDRLVARDDTIRAIKLLRTTVPGLSLVDAKNHVDAWRTTGHTGVIGVQGTVPADGAATAWAPDVVADIDRYITERKPIQAIKLVREHTGWGLREAKEWVDARTAGR
ncbi:hypothetical protein [Luteimicrobium sp. DT211]|uniref:hypothetical protein n=1 Tax=Luteimicrobium sp. DT211 TaxID=3393412 RepID=UPI003CFAB718